MLSDFTGVKTFYQERKMETDKELESRIDQILQAEKDNVIPRMTKRDYIIAAIITAISLLGIIGGFFL